ncbi:MAG: hypothetical protein E7168_00455 [Firmicutes bacterium]|nr:hypothetical protein [Bacillota bacterium]
MWKRLDDEEKRNLMANYKLGAYSVRFLMGAWLIFLTFGYISGVEGAIISISEGNYFSGVGSLVGGVVAAIFLYGIPIFAIKKIGTEEIRALKNDEVYYGQAFFVSGRRKLQKRDRPARYVAKVNILDGFGNIYKQVECRSIGNLRILCKEGDRITVLRIVKENEEELIAMKSKLL